VLLRTRAQFAGSAPFQRGEHARADTTLNCFARYRATSYYVELASTTDIGAEGDRQHRVAAQANSAASVASVREREYPVNSVEKKDEY